MSLSPGSRLGPYEILSAIGAGGMGEVYRRLCLLRDLPFGHRAAARPDAQAFGLGGRFATGAESFKRSCAPAPAARVVSLSDFAKLCRAAIAHDSFVR